MEQPAMKRSFRAIAGVPLVALAVVACESVSHDRRASALDYLYPKGVPAQPPTDVALELPLRVGISFAPSEERTRASQSAAGAPTTEVMLGPNVAEYAASRGEHEFDESKKRALLEQIASAFRGRPEIERVEVVPTYDLAPQGGFDNLDKIAARDGLETMVLLSYEQVQFDETKKSSLLYWTVVGAYVIEGNRNETRTLIDASVFDIRSRALLFRAAGQSTVEGSSTAVDAATELRRASTEGFDLATKALIADLNKNLEGFREQAKSGTVRGAGTPAITVSAEPGYQGTNGAGALAWFDALLIALLGAAGLAAWKRSRSAA
jgi:rhombotail lipoprotein